MAANKPRKPVARKSRTSGPKPVVDPAPSKPAGSESPPAQDNNDLRERTQAEHQLAANLDAMTRLQRIGSLFAREKNLEPILAEILDAAIAISEADFGTIQLLDPTTGQLRIMAQRGFPAWWLDYWNVAGRGHGACGTALERNERVIVEDVAQSPIFAGTPACDIQLRAGVRAVQSTPLVSRPGKPLGMFSTHYRSPRRPDERALRLLDLLARQTADIIERMRTEGALHESQRRLRLALGAARMGTFDWDIASGKILWSPETERIWGLPEGGFDGTYEHWKKLIHPADLPAAETLAQKAAATPDAPYEMEHRIIRPDGSVGWVLEKATTIRSAAGQAVRVVGINMEITERKEAEQVMRKFNVQLAKAVARRTAEVKEREDRLRAIVDSAFSAVITIDYRGIIEGVNQTAERMFGYTAAEMIGQNIKMLVPAPHHDAHDGYLQRYHETGIKHILGTSRELQARRKDGTLIDVALSVSQIDRLGLFVGILLDVSNRKELEREVVEISTLEQERIGRDLHDDVGQELAGQGLLAASLVAALGDESAENRALAQKIVNSTGRVLKRVRDMSQGLTTGEVDPDRLPEALAELAAHINENPQIRCVVQADLDVRVLCTLQATHLYHIAQRACTNALKHAGARNLDVSLRRADRTVVLQIQDDGVGIGEAAAGLGRRIMASRASVIGASLTIGPAQPRGTVVCCTLAEEALHVRG
jgi:PAS domain S-box-containing protein